ncbi:LamG-like jellyroll fold domain-containing protein [Streptomyces sp. NPDC054833]
MPTYSSVSWSSYKRYSAVRPDSPGISERITAVPYHGALTPPTSCCQSPKTNKWFHLVGVFDADTQQLRLYVNGDLADTASYDGTLWNATGPLQIGRRISEGAYGEYTEGKVADVQLLTEALTPGGVASLDRYRPVPTELS